MRVELTDTSASDIDAALTHERHRMGSPAVGMVLTFLIVTDEGGYKEAVDAATAAAREHPCRILAVIAGSGKAESRLDAEIHVGLGEGPGETVLLRLSGPLRHHPESVVLPLLLTDAPVVTWWPAAAPHVPGQDPVGALAGRRITDAAARSSAEHALVARGSGYHAGDTDLAWTRTTPWRAILAAALDQPHATITGSSVHAEQDNPSATLLATWLADKLDIGVERRTSRGPGITDVHLKLARGEIALTRPDGRFATLSRPTQPDRSVGLHRRTLSELLVEELRWLDTDEVYGETVQRAGGKLAAARG